MYVNVGGYKMEKFLLWLNESPENFFIFLTAIVLLVSSAATVIIHVCSTRFGKISKLNEEINKLKSENDELNSKISEFNNLEKIDSQMKSDADGDYLMWEEKSIKVCPACWYHDKKITPIQTSSMDGTYECSRCKHNGILNKNQHQLMVNYMTLMMSKQNNTQ